MRNVFLGLVLVLAPGCGASGADVMRITASTMRVICGFLGSAAPAVELLPDGGVRAVEILPDGGTRPLPTDGGAR